MLRLVTGSKILHRKVVCYPVHLKLASFSSGANFDKIFGTANETSSLLMNDKGATLTLNSGKIGHFADSSIMCKYGNTVIHVAIASARVDNPTSDFLPLTVDYRNRMYGHGVIPGAPGSGNRRERSGGDEEILVSRIIDRCIRPLFPKGYVNEVQVTVTAHSVDNTGNGGDPVVASVLAASYALRKSTQPWYNVPSADAIEGSSFEAGAIGCVRLGLINGKFIVNPTTEQLACSDMDLLYSGTEQRPLMIEFSGKEVPESVVSEAFEVAQKAMIPGIQYQLQLARETALSLPDSRRMKSGFVLPLSVQQAVESFGYQRAMEIFSGRSILNSTNPSVADGSSAVTTVTKFDRSRAEGAHQASIKRWLNEYTYQPESIASTTVPVASEEVIDTPAVHLHPVQCSMAAEHVMSKAFRSVLLTGAVDATRADGRLLNELRPIDCIADVLPAPVHGSAVFRRGDTQVLCTTTLGSKQDAKTLSPLQPRALSNNNTLNSPTDTSSATRTTDNFMLHYDFPPYCTGEVGNASALNRRMVGHGYLAEKALRGVLPPFHNYPYSIRVYSETTSSSGSSSMASVVGGCMALLDAGVPVKNLVAGVSMGLVTSDVYNRPTNNESEAELRELSRAGNYTLITDILGSEDHYGDMDFKVAGTRSGLTAIQLDVKLNYGIPIHLLSEALQDGRTARLKIIDLMERSTQHPIAPTVMNIMSSTNDDATVVNTISPVVPAVKQLTMTAVPYLRSPQSVKRFAPRAEIVLYSNPEKRKSIIGPAGEMLRYIQEAYKVVVDIDDTGVVYIYGCEDQSNVVEASMLIRDLVADIKVDEVFYNVSIVDIKEFGVMVKLTRAQEGMLHISELTHNQSLLKVASLHEVFEVGQVLSGGIVVMNVDKSTGQVKVSRKKLLSASDSESDAFVLNNGVSAVPLHNDTESNGDDVGGISLTPPRKYDPNYFKSQVATQADIDEASETKVNSSAANGTASVAARLSMDAASSKVKASPGSVDKPGKDSDKQTNNNKSKGNKSKSSSNNDKRSKPSKPTSSVDAVSTSTLATASTDIENDEDGDMEGEGYESMDDSDDLMIDASDVVTQSDNVNSKASGGISSDVANSDSITGTRSYSTLVRRPFSHARRMFCTAVTSKHPIDDSSMELNSSSAPVTQYQRVAFSQYAEDSDDKSEADFNHINNTTDDAAVYMEGDDRNVVLHAQNEFHCTVSHKVESVVEDVVLKEALMNYQPQAGSVREQRAAEWERVYSAKSVLLNDFDKILASTPFPPPTATVTAASSTSVDSIASDSGSMSSNLSSHMKNLYQLFTKSVDEVLFEKEQADKSPIQPITSDINSNSKAVMTASSDSESRQRDNSDLYSVITMLQKQRDLLEVTGNNQSSTRNSSELNVDDSKLSESTQRGEALKRDMLQLFASYSNIKDHQIAK